MRNDVKGNGTDDVEGFEEFLEEFSSTVSRVNVMSKTMRKLSNQSKIDQIFQVPKLDLEDYVMIPTRNVHVHLSKCTKWTGEKHKDFASETLFNVDVDEVRNQVTIL